MRAATLIETIKAMYSTSLKRSICIEGAPGGGKTSVVQQVAKELGVHYIEKHMPTMLVEDFGVPDLIKDGNTFGYKIPDWFPAKGTAYDDGKGGILCFDDRNQSNADLQKVLANICQAKNLHGVQMADGWMVVSTGNRQSDRAGSNRVLSHLRNRETVIEYETHLDDWTQWAIDNGVRSEVVSFIRFRTGLLHQFDPNLDVNPTPRSWVEGVSPILDVVPKDAEFECFKGAVGEGPAAEFTGYLKIYRNLPNPDVILMNPETAKVPTDPATLYALTGSLAARATESNFDRLVKYLGRIPPEFGVLCMTMAVRRDNNLCQTATFGRWSVENQNVLF